jgi:hypothetical protein
MDRFLQADAVRHMGDPGPVGPMSPRALAEHVAHMVWESFSDFLSDPEVHAVLGALGIPLDEGVPDERTSGELLIFHLWAHTRAVQLAFAARGEAALLKDILDALHGAVFQDMVENGTPRAHLPVFEQRVSARYAEYYQAAEVSDDRVGRVALAHLVPRKGERPAVAARLLTRRALEVANPLRDFLEEVKLTGMES